jgi:Flp pilus assembly pilin Flp
VEYGLLIAAIAAVIALIVFAIGGLVKAALFEKTCQQMKDGMQDTTVSCSG